MLVTPRGAMPAACSDGNPRFGTRGCHDENRPPRPQDFYARELRLQLCREEAVKTAVYRENTVRNHGERKSPQIGLREKILSATMARRNLAKRSRLREKSASATIPRVTGTTTRKISAYTYDARRPPHPESVSTFTRERSICNYGEKTDRARLREKGISATIPRGIAMVTRKTSACTYDARRPAASGEG
jgi:hypothetical protein